MSAEKATGTCPECGAANPVTATRCWMCGRTAWTVATPGSVPAAPDKSTPVAPGATEEIWISEEQHPAQPGLRDTQKNRWLILGTTVLVIAGVGWEAPGLATLLAVVVGFPLLITLATAARREARFHRQVAAGRIQSAASEGGPESPTARPMSGGEQVGVFFKWMAFAAGSVLVTAALLVILVAVMVISLVTALLEACGILFHTAQGG